MSLFGGKNSKKIKFSETLDLRPYMTSRTGPPLPYSLYGVLVHSGGSCNSGHYYCYVKASNNHWYCMNDSHVSLYTTLSYFWFHFICTALPQFVVVYYLTNYDIKLLIKLLLLFEIYRFLNQVLTLCYFKKLIYYFIFLHQRYAIV